MAQSHKTRNHIGLAGVAQNRHEIYVKAFEHYSLAMDQGFYLEAIAIIESIIADRMESRLGELQYG
jgi:hypothetical protein